MGMLPSMVVAAGTGVTTALDKKGIGTDFASPSFADILAGFLGNFAGPVEVEDATNAAAAALQVRLETKDGSSFTLAGLVSEDGCAVPEPKASPVSPLEQRLGPELVTVAGSGGDCCGAAFGSGEVLVPASPVAHSEVLAPEKPGVIPGEQTEASAEDALAAPAREPHAQESAPGRYEAAGISRVPHFEGGFYPALPLEPGLVRTGVETVLHLLPAEASGSARTVPDPVLPVPRIAVPAADAAFPSLPRSPVAGAIGKDGGDQKEPVSFVNAFSGPETLAPEANGDRPALSFPGAAVQPWGRQSQAPNLAKVVAPAPSQGDAGKTAVSPEELATSFEETQVKVSGENRVAAHSVLSSRGVARQDNGPDPVVTTSGQEGLPVKASGTPVLAFAPNKSFWRSDFSGGFGAMITAFARETPQEVPHVGIGFGTTVTAFAPAVFTQANETPAPDTLPSTHLLQVPVKDTKLVFERVATGASEEVAFTGEGARMSLEDLPRQLAPEIVRRITAFSNHQGVIRVELRLDPPELGSVGVRLVVTGDELKAHFFTADAAVREILLATLPELKVDLGRAGFHLGEASVSVGQEQNEESQPPPRWGGTFRVGGGAGHAAEVTPLAEGVNFLV